MKLIPYIFLIIAISGIIGGAAAIVLDKFGNTMTPCAAYHELRTDGLACINDSGNTSVGYWNGPHNLTTGVDGLNMTDEYYTKTKSIEGIGTVAEQLPTVAIIGIMVIIISIIAGVLVYMKYFS